MKRLSIIISLLITFLVILAGCDNGSVSDSALSKADGLVEVCLTVDGQATGVQKSLSLAGLNYVYQYQAVPQWSQNWPIHGRTSDWVTFNYSGNNMSLGRFTAGAWKFYIRVLNEGTPIFQGESAVISISTSQVSVTVAVAKIIQDATPGIVSITVTAPTIDENTDALTVSWTGTASGSGAATPDVTGGITTFTYTKNNLPVGFYTFTLSHNNAVAGGSAIAVDLHQGEMAIVTGHLDTGEWRLGYITVPLHTVTVERHNWGTPQAPKYFGTIDIEIDSAVKGDRVSLFTKPVSGSSVRSISITCGGTPVAFSRSGELYSFIMPDGDVDVYVTFENVSTSIIDVMLFRALVQALYVENRATVESFGQAASSPGVGVKPISLGDVKMWYDTSLHKISWYSEVEEVNLGEGSLAGLFEGCDRLTSISMANIITTSITDMSNMFKGCAGLTSLDLTGLNASSATTMTSMFQGCTSLASLDLSNFDASSATDISNMFQGCTSLASLDLSGFDASSATDMSALFQGCTSLATLDLSGADVSSVIDMSALFQGCTSLASLDLSGFDASSATDMSDMFRDCINLVTLDLDGFTVNTANNIEVDMQGLFRGCVKLRGKNNVLDLSSFNTSRVKDMSYMFCECKALTEIEFGDHFDTSLVTDMSYMFSSVDEGTAGGAANKMNLTSLDVSGFDTQNVTNMSHMFYMCSNVGLTTLAVSQFNTSKVTDMSYMFGCWEGAPSYVTSFNLSGWDFSKVTTVNRMFDRCQYATTITFPERTKWSRIEDMLYMFSNCYRLTRDQLKIIIAEWDFSEHNNTTALSALFSTVTDSDSNPEASPSNRLFKNNMCYSKHHVPGGADFDTRDEYPTYNINTNPIKKLYIGGDIEHHIAYQRLTTVETIIIP